MHDDRASMPAPPSPLTMTHEMPDHGHIGMHTLGRNISRKNIIRPGSQSPPLPPPPPPEDDDHQHFGRPRTQSQGPLAPIVPEDQNLPGWVPKNYIEKGNCFVAALILVLDLLINSIPFHSLQWSPFTIIMLTKTMS